nr:RNA polymerase beta subunit [Trentepohlia sp. YN1242]
MSGRHGNKGIVSKIIPFFDMPYLTDGTPIEIVLNPLGVPSRMNVGQIYESLLGLAGFYKNEYFRIPPFDENVRAVKFLYDYQFSRNLVYWQLNELNKQHYYEYNSHYKDDSEVFTQTTNLTYQIPYRLKKNFESSKFVNKLSSGNQFNLLNWSSSFTNKNHKLGSKLEKTISNLVTGTKIGLNPYFPGKMRLLDGQTGETFFRPVIIGKSYMLKLNHLVDSKIHARATGPYALITQQPLKGKRNQGGQRVGEMEVWALYAFGSASLLFEMLTTKSDDPIGRERVLREIAGLPRDPSDKGISEAFRVLVMNLRALCLDLSVFKDFFFKSQLY